MKSAWTSVSQKEFECFLGLRERDFEFEKKTEELTLAQQELDRIKEVLLSFANQTQGLPVLYEDISNNIIQAYSKDNCFFDFIQNVVRIHKELQAAYFNCKDLMETIVNDTQQWKDIYSQAEKDILDRNEKFKTYEHYDIKMEQLVKERNEKLNKKKTESDKDIEKYSRNYDKYLQATNEFIESSNKAYLIIHNLLNNKYSLISQAVTNFILFEKKFFDRVSQILSYYNNAKPMLDDYNRRYVKKGIEYDATKFIRGRRMNGVISPSIKTAPSQGGSSGYHKSHSSKNVPPGNLLAPMNYMNPNGKGNTPNQQSSFGNTYAYQQSTTPSFVQPIMQSKITPEGSQLRSQMSMGNPSQYQQSSKVNPNQKPYVQSQMGNNNINIHQQSQLTNNNNQSVNPYLKSQMGSSNNQGVNPYQQSQMSNYPQPHNLSHSNYPNQVNYNSSVTPKPASNSVNYPPTSQK